MANEYTRSLQQHPLSAAFPAMPAEDFEALAEDIRKHGLREAIVLHEGMVLDGWHRHQACAKAERKTKTVEFDGDDPRAFVLSQNLHRRHLTGSQRAIAVVSCSNWRPTGVTGGRVEAASTLTNAEMAKAAEVSSRTIRAAKQAEKAGLGNAVRDGTVSVDRAAEIAAMPKSQRAKALKEPAKPKVIIAERKFEKLYEEVKAELVETREKRDELADIAAELNDKLAMYEATEPDEQQNLIAELQLSVRRKDAEIDRQRVMIRDANNKNNELIRTVKRLQKKAGIGQ